MYITQSSVTTVSSVAALPFVATVLPFVATTVLPFVATVLLFVATVLPLTPIYTGSVEMLPAGEGSCAHEDPYKVLYSRWMYALHDAFSTTLTTTPSYSTEPRLEELWHHLFNERGLMLPRGA